MLLCCRFVDDFLKYTDDFNRSECIAAQDSIIILHNAYWMQNIEAS